MRGVRFISTKSFKDRSKESLFGQLTVEDLTVTVFTNVLYSLPQWKSFSF